MPKFFLTDEQWENIANNRFMLIPIVLDELNDIRMAIGIGEGKLQELPKSIRGNERQCVIARALSNGWEAEVGAYSTTLTHPPSPSIDRIKIIKALEQLGFEASDDSDTAFWVEEKSDVIGGHWAYTNELPEDVNPAEMTITTITVQNSQAMRYMVRWFDDDVFPDLFENPLMPGRAADDSEVE